MMGSKASKAGEDGDPVFLVSVCSDTEQWLVRWQWQYLGGSQAKVLASSRLTCQDEPEIVSFMVDSSVEKKTMYGLSSSNHARYCTRVLCKVGGWWLTSSGLLDGWLRLNSSNSDQPQLGSFDHAIKTQRGAQNESLIVRQRQALHALLRLAVRSEAEIVVGKVEECEVGKKEEIRSECKGRPKYSWRADSDKQKTSVGSV
ncbi:hypothetical protein QBC37DRAFT_417517 [Rhypophila decipiens]|uniref:Uncharacterized protein n=1 Tax=Rhypophila decipiens TaxID=261697 RepID=A0AAN6YBV9_9PEZI|nr:hypothetical protein QBC37DRAFT_417517 [Rhypophila decipiens]